MADLWDIGSCLPANICGEVYGVKKWVSLNVICSTSSKPLFGRTAQFYDEVSCFRTQLDLGGNVQGVLPVYHLKGKNTQLTFTNTPLELQDFTIQVSSLLAKQTAEKHNQTVDPNGSSTFDYTPCSSSFCCSKINLRKTAEITAKNSYLKGKPGRYFAFSISLVSSCQISSTTTDLRGSVTGPILFNLPLRIQLQCSPDKRCYLYLEKVNVSVSLPPPSRAFPVGVAASVLEGFIELGPQSSSNITTTHSHIQMGPQHPEKLLCYSCWRPKNNWLAPQFRQQQDNLKAIAKIKLVCLATSPCCWRPDSRCILEYRQCL